MYLLPLLDALPLVLRPSGKRLLPLVGIRSHAAICRLHHVLVIPEKNFESFLIFSALLSGREEL